jgi:hypothetical protein
MGNVQKPFSENPAGRTDGTQRQPEDVLVLNARDERAISWLIEQSGFDAVQRACNSIAGNRKPYPTNLARVLGLSIPQSVIDTPVSVARERILRLRALLASKQS